MRYRVVTTVLLDTGLSQHCCEIQGCHNSVVRYRVVMTVLLKTQLFWDMMLCHWMNSS